ncbi:thermonuclease family protein [Candidatus Bipolaricaulota bacterium]|nr:thermonuclease family protein [Candidatus Bipolaricaulota bacterium]
MKRKVVLVGGAAIIVLAVALGLWFGLHRRPEYVSIRDKVIVDDGDTFYFENQFVSLPSGNSTNKVRLLGIDAPEEGQDWYEKAKEFFESQIGLSERTIYLKVPDEPQDQLDKWRRLLAVVYLDKACEQSLNEMLIEEGMAIIYKLPKSLEDLKIVSDCLLDAQVQAAFGRKGRWDTDQQVVIAAIRYWGSPEQVVLINRGDHVISLEGWYLIDAAPERPHKFDLETEISPPEIRPGSMVRFSTERVWNDDGDTARLYDDQGILVDTYQYKGPG